MDQIIPVFVKPVRGRGLVRLALAAGLVLMMLALAGCGAPGMGQSSRPASSPPGAQSPQAPAKPPTTGKGEAGPADSTVYAASLDRKIIKNADLSIDVENLADALRQIELKTEQAGGYVQDSSSGSRSGDERFAKITARVPSERFLDVLQAVESLGKITNRRVFTEDVTEQYIDLESRIANLKEQQKRLREILSQAKKVEEILQIEKELERVGQECDSLSGRLRFLKNRVEISTITVALRETPAASQNVSTRPLGSAWSRGASAFVSTVNHLVAAGAGLVVFLMGTAPVLVILGAVTWIALNIRKRIFRRGGPTSPPAG
ncbi:MAG: DUF4349 domain-containing protein [Firmicutes bacterium]|nr:DUF4349 domain-containing protein [Bacillota bacterium]